MQVLGINKLQGYWWFQRMDNHSICAGQLGQKSLWLVVQVGFHHRVPLRQGQTSQTDLKSNHVNTKYETMIMAEQSAPIIAETARLLAVSASFFFSAEPSWRVDTACQ